MLSPVVQSCRKFLHVRLVDSEFPTTIIRKHGSTSVSILVNYHQGNLCTYIKKTDAERKCAGEMDVPEARSRCEEEFYL